MRNKLLTFLREQKMLTPGDRVICAVSGGADSMALLWCLYLMKDKLDITLEAAHYNHRLRGAESDRDEAFVREFCRTQGIVCHFGGGVVEAGQKGLEAAARDARYGFFETLPGKVATAHTADDNAETVLMHLVRGTGLKGLGGIAPIRGKYIRPMLTVTRQEVLAFLQTQGIGYVTDSSNLGDDFFRNRIRHSVMPILRGDNPAICENLSATALHLRQDAELLDALAQPTNSVAALRSMPPSLQNRALGRLLTEFGVKEPEAGHIALLRRVVYSENPSACGVFPGGIQIARQYDRLIPAEECPALPEIVLQNPGVTHIPQWGITVTCGPLSDAREGWRVRTEGTLTLRSRMEGDTIVLSGGRKTLKKLFIDRKIPASRRAGIPVIADDRGVVGVHGIGPGCDRLEAPNTVITVTDNERIKKEEGKNL